LKQYQQLIQHVLDNGVTKSDRTGTGIKSVFGYQMRFDLADGFPLVTTKKIHYPAIIHELLWFLSGSTNINYLKENNVKIWDAWAVQKVYYNLKVNSIGPMYGSQWTSWQNPDGTSINQIQQAVDLLKTNPNSRRIIVSAWNPSDLPDESVSPQANVANGKMALAACHAFFQFYVVDGKLSCQLYQRSADVFLGVPFNISSYALLVHMMAQQCNMEVGEFIWTGGDTHIYSNHYDQVELQLTRTPMNLPTLQINRKPDSIFDYKFEDFTINNYDPYPLIKGAVAV